VMGTRNCFELIQAHGFEFILLQAVAYAESSDCKFQIRLFKADSDSSSTTGPSVLVEVQRRRGCCVKFHSIAMKILCAAKGCEYRDECPHYTIGRDVIEQCMDHDLSVRLDLAPGMAEPTCDCGQSIGLHRLHGSCITDASDGTF